MWMIVIILAVVVIILWALRQNKKEEKERSLRCKPKFPESKEFLERKAIAEPSPVLVRASNFDWDFFEAFIEDLQKKYSYISDDPLYESFEAIELVKKEKEKEKDRISV